MMKDDYEIDDDDDGGGEDDGGGQTADPDPGRIEEPPARTPMRLNRRILHPTRPPAVGHRPATPEAPGTDPTPSAFSRTTHLGPARQATLHFTYSTKTVATRIFT